MSDLLLAALERLPQRVRRFVVAIGALLALGAVMAALTLTASHGGQERRPAPQHPAATVPRTSPRRLPPPVSTAAMLQARRAAKRFLAGYLPFAYGRGSALAIRGITQTLRRQLLSPAGSADAGRESPPPAGRGAADDRHDARVRGRDGGHR